MEEVRDLENATPWPSFKEGYEYITQVKRGYCTVFVDPSVYQEVITAIKSEIKIQAEFYEVPGSDARSFWKIFRHNRYLRSKFPTFFFVEYRIESMDEIFDNEGFVFMYHSSDEVYVANDAAMGIRLLLIKQRD